MTDPQSTWFDGAAFDIFIADGGVDDFDLMSDEELRLTISQVLPNYVPMILESAKKLKDWAS